MACHLLASPSSRFAIFERLSPGWTVIVRGWSELGAVDELPPSTSEKSAFGVSAISFPPVWCGANWERVMMCNRYAGSLDDRRISELSVEIVRPATAQRR